jgi:pyrroline-5-carboxylate reductase
MTLAKRLGQIAVIGGGKMGEAIIAGMIGGAAVAPASICVVEPGEERRVALSGRHGVCCLPQLQQANSLDTIILAVKPQVLRPIAESLAALPGFCPKRVISIAAGVTTTTLQAIFGQTVVVRVMPNMALMANAGMSVVAKASATPAAETELARELFACMGKAVILLEQQIDTATAISGSGPAYFALLVQALAIAAENNGLSADTARLLSEQTLLGTAQLFRSDGYTAAALMAAVTSPGGTTQAALESFEQNRLLQSVEDAVGAAIARAKELS